MNCPSCFLKGHLVKMNMIRILNHKNKIGWVCNVDPKHWEVTDKLDREE